MDVSLGASCFDLLTLRRLCTRGQLHMFTRQSLFRPQPPPVACLAALGRFRFAFLSFWRSSDALHALAVRRNAVFPGTAKAEDLPKNFDPTESEKRLYEWHAAAPPRRTRAHVLPGFQSNRLRPLPAAGLSHTACRPDSAPRWQSNGYFKPRGTGEPYVIPMPPPNVTGALHMGHAMFVTLQARRRRSPLPIPLSPAANLPRSLSITPPRRLPPLPAPLSQDMMVRYKRMKGFDALWVPGTDHAGIATQMVVEKLLATEGTSRKALGREKFLERVWAWKEQYGSRIVEQIKRLGASCDWERERFTLDDGLSAAVRARPPPRRLSQPAPRAPPACPPWPTYFANHPQRQTTGGAQQSADRSKFTPTCSALLLLALRSQRRS